MAKKDKDTEEIKEQSVIRFAVSAETSVNMDARTMVATITTPTISHNDMSIDPDGISLKVYRTNPVVMWSHDYYIPPVGRNLWVKRDGSALVAKTFFATRPETFPATQEWLPDTLLSLYEQNVLRGVSVGLKINEMHEPTKEEIKENAKLKEAFMVISKSELMEYSCCSIPMNPDALRHMYAAGWEPSKGLLQVLRLPTEPEPVVDVDGHPIVTTTKLSAEDLEEPQSKPIDEKELLIELGITASQISPLSNEHVGEVRKEEDFEGVEELFQEYEGREYRVLWGYLKDTKQREICSFCYPQDKWSEDEARTHCRAHEGKVFKMAKLEESEPLPSVLTSQKVAQMVQGLGNDPEILDNILNSVDVSHVVGDAVDKLCGRV